VTEGYLQELYGMGMASSAAPAPKQTSVAHSAADVAPSTAQTGATFGDKQQFGAGGATIESARLVSSDGVALTSVGGGELVRLEVTVRSAVALASPIVGFIVKDRLGQHLFGDNTYRRYSASPLKTAAHARLEAAFTFRMPILPRGEYSIAVAVSDGTQSDHLVHQWVHDALLFQSHSQSEVSGLVGIPIEQTTLRSLPETLHAGAHD